MTAICDNINRCFILSIFDLDYEESVNLILVQSLIQCKIETDPKLIWCYLTDFAEYVISELGQSHMIIFHSTASSQNLTGFGCLWLFSKVG